MKYLVLMICSAVAVLIAFHAGLNIAASNASYAAGEPAAWDGLQGIGLMILAVVFGVLPSALIGMDEYERRATTR